MKIIKRSGSEAVFDVDKIVSAIRKANDSVIDYEKLKDEQITEIAENVEIGKGTVVVAERFIRRFIALGSSACSPGVST